MKTTTLFVFAMLFACINSAYIIEGLYRITCVANGNVLDIEDEHVTDGTNLIVFGWHDGTNQQFYIEYVDGDWATLVAKNSGKALTISGLSTGPKYTQQTNIESKEQQFRFSSTHDQHFLITNRKSGLVMECNGDISTDERGNKYALQGVRDCGNGQKFDFIKLDNPIPS